MKAIYDRSSFQKFLGFDCFGGTVPDETSKKNKSKQRNPQTTSTRKNNKWYFGAKGHIEVQSDGKPIIHSCVFSTAKDTDITHMTNLFHGKERAIFSNSAYTSKVDKVGARFLGLYHGISDRVA